MRFRTTLLLSILVLSLPALASTHTRRGPTAQRLSSKRAPAKSKPISQRTIDSGRTTEIQNALVAQGYLSTPATGTWTPETESALRKLQSDNGWQTKTVPDSRAIIKLGLGPGSPHMEGSSASPASSVAPQAAAEPESPTPAQQ